TVMLQAARRADRRRRRGQRDVVDEESVARVPGVRVAGLAEEQLAHERHVVPRRRLLRVIAVVVLPGRAGLLQGTVDVDVDDVGRVRPEADVELDCVSACLSPKLPLVVASDNRSACVPKPKLLPVTSATATSYGPVFVQPCWPLMLPSV